MQLFQHIVGTENKKKMNKAELKKLNEEELMLLKTITKLERRRNKIIDELIEVNEVLKDRCRHPVTRIEDKYSEGGYLNRSEYITTIYCSVCGTKLDENIVGGGFG